ncbi:MAG: DUF362 domain-containing protein, partial [Candidatus Theseobacter exili]|nr:DUF362 domain-containing protein [Candidatus Theseobacter exili]
FVRPGLALIDGIIGMEGEGPASGDAVNTGVLIASSDIVAADAVASVIMGFDPMKNAIIRGGYERGYGEARFDKINIKGDSIELFTAKPFKKPKGMSQKKILLKYFPKNIIKLIIWFLGRMPFIKYGECRGCGVCQNVCPYNAISMKNKKPYVNPAKCRECFCCQEFCPYDAILLLKKPFVYLHNFLHFHF